MIEIVSQDNVSASARGGFNIVTRTPVDESEMITTFPPPRDLGLAILVPNIEKTSTEAAREHVPPQVRSLEHVQVIGRTVRISAAFATSNVWMILVTQPWDGVVEPARADEGVYGAGADAKFLMEKKFMLDRFHVAETISEAGPSRGLWHSISEDLRRRRENKIGIIQPAIALAIERLRTLGHDVREVFITKPSSKGVVLL